MKITKLLLTTILSMVFLVILYGLIPSFFNLISYNNQEGVARRILYTRSSIFPIIGGNFEPTFYNGDLILFSRLSIKSELKRGQLVIYEVPDCPKGEEYNNCFYFSRVLGLSGETVRLNDSYIEINNQKLHENYAQWRNNKPTNLGPNKYQLGEVIEIPTNHYFLLDDDRTWDADDSRTFGPIARENIIGNYEFLMYRNFITRYPPPLF